MVARIMLQPLKIYLDAVDLDAYDKAESGEMILPKSDWPIAPLFVPWIVGGPLLAWLSDRGTIETIVFLTTLCASVSGYLWCALHYQRLVHKYREELGATRES